MNEKRPLDFRAGRIVKGHGLYASLPLAERVRAARGIPQAVVKVVSYGQGIKAATRLLNYISRKGDLPLETEYGDLLTDTDQQKTLVKEWADDFKKAKNKRDTVHLVFSAPWGSDRDALRKTIRQVLYKRFSGHQAVFAIHEDKKHPHAHLVIKMFNRETGKKLRLNRPDLYELREIFAEAAREYGIEMAVSPRGARGVGRKARRRVPYQLHQKGDIPIAEKETAREVLDDLEAGRLEDKPWEIAMRKRHEIEKRAYRVEGLRLRTEAQGLLPGRDKAGLLKVAEELERFGNSMPTPQTFRQSLLDSTRNRRSKPQSPSPRTDHSSELDR